MEKTEFTFADSDSDEGDADSPVEGPSPTKALDSNRSIPFAKLPSRLRSNRRIFVEDKQKKNIDDFLAKIKADQTRRADGAIPAAAPSFRGICGAEEHDDPLTTNIYVGNLHPNTDEDRLQLLFGKFGPLASIKVMWPRTSEDHARGHNSGFVCFMNRRDAERAHDTMHGADIDGCTVRTAWGKALPRVEEPIPCLPGQVWHSFAEYEPDAAMLKGDDSLPIVVVQPPLDLKRRSQIDEFAAAMADKGGNGREFERMKSEMLGTDSDDETYFRWRLYSLLQGETATEWRTEKFAMSQGGPLWLPPPCSRPRNNPPIRKPGESTSSAVVDTTGADRERANVVLHEAVGTVDIGGTISDVQSLLNHLSTLDSPLPRHVGEEFEEILTALCTGRESIQNGMVFCLEHGENAGSLTAMIANRAMSSQAAAGKRLACLYLFSDILHNSQSVTLKGVWAFQKRFEAILEHVFIFFRKIRTENGNMTDEKFSEKVALVLTVWVEWTIFSSEFLSQLNRAYHGTVTSQPERLEKVEQKIADTLGPMPDCETRTCALHNPHSSDMLALQKCDRPHGNQSPGDDSSEDDLDGIPVDTLLNL